MQIVRSHTQFSRQRAFSKAVEAIAGADELVLYCGAGVTIDFTGLDWGALNARLFNDLITGLPTVPEAKNLLSIMGPVEISSILEVAFEQEQGDVQEGRNVRETRMRDALYRTKHWQAGNLAESICRLATAFMRRGRPVTILTTNQDTFLERAYTTYVTEALARGHSLGVPDTPLVEVLGESQDETAPDPDQLKIIYLHGRIPDHGQGPVRGVIPNGEVDFSTRHTVVRDEIYRHLQRASGAFVSVGSSLRDQPVIEALALDRGGTLDKYALTPVPFTELKIESDASEARYLKFLNFRAKHLGFKFIFADFFSQYPQFFQEIVAQMGGKGMSHGARLDAWERAWSDTPFGSDPAYAYTRTSDLLNDIREEILATTNDYEAPINELMRIEVWRRIPSSRKLQLHAQSSGEIRDHSLTRNADIAHRSGNCSVDAFIEGRPIMRRAKDYARVRADSQPWEARWKHYLSVPVTIPFGNGVVSVGVVTLATMSETSALTAMRDGSPETLLSICKKMNQHGRDYLGTGLSRAGDGEPRSLETQAIEIVASFDL